MTRFAFRANYDHSSPYDSSWFALQTNCTQQQSLHQPAHNFTLPHVHAANQAPALHSMRSVPFLPCSPMLSGGAVDGRLIRVAQPVVFDTQEAAA